MVAEQIRVAVNIATHRKDLSYWKLPDIPKHFRKSTTDFHGRSDVLVLVCSDQATEIMQYGIATFRLKIVRLAPDRTAAHSNHLLPADISAFQTGQGELQHLALVKTIPKVWNVCRMANADLDPIQRALVPIESVAFARDALLFKDGGETQGTEMHKKTRVLPVIVLRTVDVSVEPPWEVTVKVLRPRRNFFQREDSVLQSDCLAHLVEFFALPPGLEVNQTPQKHNGYIFAGEVVQGLHTHGLIVLVDRVDEDDNARLVAILEICHTEGWPAKDYWTHSTRMRD